MVILPRPRRGLIRTIKQGLRLQIALHHFRSPVSHDGLQGYFEITLKSDNQFQQLTRW